VFFWIASVGAAEFVGPGLSPAGRGGNTWVSSGVHSTLTSKFPFKPVSSITDRPSKRDNIGVRSEIGMLVAFSRFGPIIVPPQERGGGAPGCGGAGGRDGSRMLATPVFRFHQIGTCQLEHKRASGSVVICTFTAATTVHMPSGALRGLRISF
jgi:hypothetical protein